MRNTSLRKTVVLAVSMGLLIAAVSGGAVTYASFTDSGNVDVTFTAGNISDTPEITTSEANGNGSDEMNDATETTDGNATETTDGNATETTDGNATENASETSQAVSDRMSGEGTPTTDGLTIDRPSDVIPAAATTAVAHRRLPMGPPPRDG